MRVLNASVGSICLTFLFGAATALAADNQSEWVHPGANGKLEYKSTPAGDRIMDFSYAGYKGGGVALPNVPAKKTVQPSGGEDDTATIQAAIDAVGAMPLIDGSHGAVELAPGEYKCASPISISASGVVLRGGGSSGEKTSTIKLTGRPHTAITVGVPGSRRGKGKGKGDAADSEAASSGDFKPLETTITDAYVPSGVISFNVANSKNFAVGDLISIRRPVTEAWVKFMHMDDMVRDGKAETWLRPGTTTNTERKIAAIDGSKITLDVPLSDSFDAKYLNPPGVAVVKIRPPARVSEVGIEHLHIESPPQAINHTEAHFNALRMTGEDCWVRDFAIDETMNSVGVNGCRITLEQVSVMRKALHPGSSKPAEFAPNGSQVLMDRCSVTGDNIWYIGMGAGVAGPVVALNCTFKGDGAAESHQRWSTGLLLDNCRAPGGGLDFRNRGEMGSGHGWTMGWGVLWNCEAKHFIVQNPPGSANWLIGSTGEAERAPRPFGKAPLLEPSIVDSPGHAVHPQSLYLAQLAERLGPQALANLGYKSADDLAAPTH
jgi:hypothetical protein